MKFCQSRAVISKIKNAMVSQHDGGWYISFQVEIEVAQPVPPSTSAIGLDAGISKLATLSDGTIFEPVNRFKKNHVKLARLQRQLSRIMKFSANWKIQKAKIPRLHSHIANIHRDYLHKVTTIVSEKPRDNRY